MILSISDDFDLDRIAGSGQCFRWEEVSVGNFRIVNGNHCLYIESIGENRFSFSCGEEEFHDIWSDYFDLQTCYADIRARIGPDDDYFLWAASEHEKGIRILRQDPWEMLITFIISQNKNIPAIQRSVSLLAETCGMKKKDCRGREYRTFPTPASVAALDHKALSECGLGYRCRYVHAAAEAVATGMLDLESLRFADEERTINALKAVCGVGEKVANCVSLFGLHHLDAFPKDVWMKRVLENEYPEGYPFSTYSPYNGVYQQYMFAFYRRKETELCTSRKANNTCLTILGP